MIDIPLSFLLSASFAESQELKEQGAQREVFAFFKHEEKPESALNAVTVARAVGVEEKPFVMPEKKGKKA